jgi:hypothetical protein
MLRRAARPQGDCSTRRDGDPRFAEYQPCGAARPKVLGQTGDGPDQAYKQAIPFAVRRFLHRHRDELAKER